MIWRMWVIIIMEEEAREKEEMMEEEGEGANQDLFQQFLGDALQDRSL
jgi:hypothetical protein